MALWAFPAPVNDQPVPVEQVVTSADRGGSGAKRGERLAVELVDLISRIINCFQRAAPDVGSDFIQVRRRGGGNRRPGSSDFRCVLFVHSDMG